MNNNSIRILSDINPQDVLDMAVIHCDNFQVIVRRMDDSNGVRVVVTNNGPFHVKSMVVDSDDSVVMNFVEGE